jgi:surfeit locus 1 family protein
MQMQQRIRRACGVVLVLGIFALLLSLGFWQLARLDWKQNLIARQAAALASPPVPLATVLATPEAERLFQPVTLTGYFLETPPLRVGLRLRDGKPGYHLVVPFSLSTGTLAGRVVLVNLGWLDTEAANRWRVPDSVSRQSISLYGLTRLPDPRTWLTPDNQPQQGIWYTVTPAEIMEAIRAAQPESREWGITLTTVYIQLQKIASDSAHNHAATAVWPAPLPARRDFRNDHRQYARFWFTMAGVWVAMVGLLVTRQRRGERQ